MNYSQIRFEGADIRLALFDKNRREGHAVIIPQIPQADAKAQIDILREASCFLVEYLCMKPVFKRYLLSDASNQWQLLPEKDECARSVIQQPSLDGSKAVMLVMFQDDSTFQDKGNGVWIDAKGRIWSGDDDSVKNSSSEVMTRMYLENLDKTIRETGGILKDNCIRTWFFVRDIDNNYQGVVKGRNEMFRHAGLASDTHYIASTGIAGISYMPSRLVSFNAYSDTQLVEGQISYLYGKTHLNPTYEYGVAFERGACVDYGDRRHVYISGTASINNRGKIVAPGDIKAQTERMLENIAVLLAEGEAHRDDVMHLTVYLRDIADYDVVAEIMEERFPEIPKVIVLAPVCRPGWLIEAECMAIVEKDNPAYEPF